MLQRCLVVGMDLLVPANRVFQPFRLRKSQRLFDLRADVGLANSLVQVGHENNGGNLVEQRPVARLDIGRGIARTDRMLAEAVDA